MIDGDWYVAAAGTGTQRQVFGDRGDAITDDPLRAEVTADGEWWILFLRPPPDVQTISISLDESDGAFAGISRTVP